jgi:SRSO17 transposase
MVGRTLDWKEELGRWLKPFLGRLGHKARRQMCPLYVSGLIGPGDRKSIQPMAERLALGEYDQLHHFIAAGVWDAAPVETELLVQADKLVGGSDAVLVIDDTAIPKKGAHSVGVAPQYASALGKTANCQTLVSLTLARGEVPVMLVLRLFLPESWTSNRARLERAGVPTEYRTARTKPEMALAEIDRVIAAGVRFGYVLADAGYGISAPFRQGLTARELAWAVGIPRHLKVYPADVRMIWPIAGRGRPRRRHVPDILSIAAEDMLADAPWQNISWRTGTKGKLKARFAAIRVRIADGPPQRIRDKGQQHLPGEEAWLIGEHRMSGEKKYYLANLPAKTDLRTLAATIKARWICEQAHQQLKEELGLDHFEGRSWHGLHRHALMTMIAYAFLQHRRLKTARREKKESTGRHRNQPCQRCVRPSSNSSFDHHRTNARTVENGFAASSGVSKSAKIVLVLRRYNFDLYQHRRMHQIANDERGRWAYLAHHFQENGAIRGNVISIDNITGDLNHVGQRHSGLIEQDLDLRPGLPRLDFEVSGHVALTGDVECGTGNLNQDRLTEVCEAPGTLRIELSYRHCTLLFAHKRAPAGHVWLIASPQTNELPRVGSVDKSRHS